MRGPPPRLVHQSLKGEDRNNKAPLTFPSTWSCGISLEPSAAAHIFSLASWLAVTRSIWTGEWVIEGRGAEVLERRRRSRSRQRRSIPKKVKKAFSLFSPVSFTHRVVLDFLDVEELLQARYLRLLHGRRWGGARVEDDLGRH